MSDKKIADKITCKEENVYEFKDGNLINLGDGRSVITHTMKPIDSDEMGIRMKFVTPEDHDAKPDDYYGVEFRDGKIYTEIQLSKEAAAALWFALSEMMDRKLFELEDWPLYTKTIKEEEEEADETD